MELAVFTSSSTGAVIGSGQKTTVSSFKDFRALSRLQPPSVAARLVRLSSGVEKAIKCGDPKRYARARWLEEAVGFIAQTRPNHAESQELQHCLARLFRQSFRSLDWRRSLIAGLD
jgi:hypothetical protein